ncbi:conserved protein of unknown function [Nitrosotalea devaniterrae]|uniref:Uncharacterized protein n=1 Tax=Nitrosotalea devaniterrae TaxID=1078905 RepID=A0A128A2Q1_9ARCH|nr:conserved protein of unknown function [Candidatus Nitrosotalea devanaterra]
MIIQILDLKNIFDQIPENIRRFRFEDEFFAMRKTNSGQVDFYVKDVKKKSHVHFYDYNGKSGFVFTRENRRGKHNEHTTMPNPIEFLDVIKEFIIYAWSKVERIDVTDHVFIGTKVTLYSIPVLTLDKMRDRQAYFKQEFTIEELLFEKIDLHETKFGTVVNEKGRETHLIFVRNGEIYGLSIKDLNNMEKIFEKDPRVKAFSML